MAEINPPGFLQNRADHPAVILRGMLGGLISVPGIIGATDWLVTQRAAGANMSVDVAGGHGYVLGTEDVNQGYYYCVSDATPINKVIASAHATLTRIDLVVARVYDTFYSGATNTWDIEVVTGTPGSGVAPALPANSYRIAAVTVAALATTIINANIDTTRVAAAVFQDATKAPLASPVFTGNPTGPTPAAGDNDTSLATTAFVVASTNTGLMNNQTGTAYTLALTDAWKTITFDNAAAITIHIDTDANANFLIGTEVYGMWYLGAGQPTISAVTPTTTTILSEGAASSIAPKIAAANAIVAMKKIAANTWVVTGHIA